MVAASTGRRAGRWPLWPPAPMRFDGCITAPLTLLALAVSLLLTGCVATPSATRQATSTASVTPTWTPAATYAPSPRTLSFSQAWGNVRITRLSGRLPGNLNFVFEYDATPDGQWIVGEVEPRDFAENTTFIPYLALYNVSTRQVMRVHSLLNPHSQIGTVATDGNWIVWQEASHQPDFVDWVIEAVNWHTGVFKRLAQAPTDANGAFYHGPQPQLAVDQGKALWSQTTGPIDPNDSSTSKNEEVLLADLNAGTVTTLATSAFGAALSWPWAAWGVQTDAKGDGYVQFKNFETGQTARLNQTPDKLALNGTTAVYSLYANEIDVIPDVSRGTVGRTIFQVTTPSLQSPVASDRLVTWSQTAGPNIPLVWDRQQNTLVILPTTYTQNYVAWTGGHLLIWLDSPETAAQQQQDGQNNLIPSLDMCIVDTRTLPTSPPA